MSNPNCTSKEILDALADLEKLYNPKEQMDLYVSLYDPATGGMYFSQPSVGREGYGPNIESTAQAELPVDLYTDEEKKKLGSWIQSLQDPETGWFMEPEFTVAGAPMGKKQRNHFMGMAVLRACGMKPLYPTAVERAGQQQENTSGKPAAIEDDSYLSSLDAYMDWVKNAYDWDGDAPHKRHVWAAGNEIGDFSAQLKELGWLDTVSEFIRSKQRPENGLFTDKIDMVGISAVTKLSGMFTLTGIPMPYMDKIIESAAWLAENTKFTGGSEPYNITLAMRFMVNSAGKNGISAETRAILDAAAPRFIRSIAYAMKDFHKADGGFGYCVGGPCTYSQGAHVTPPDYDCSDVNGNQLAKGVRNDLYWLAGLETPPLYDRAEFLARLRAKAPVTKPLLDLPNVRRLSMFHR